MGYWTRTLPCLQEAVDDYDVLHPTWVVTQARGEGSFRRHPPYRKLDTVRSQEGKSYTSLEYTHGHKVIWDMDQAADKLGL